MDIKMGINTEIKYEEAVSYLYGLQKFGIKLGLANISALSAIMGQPDKHFHSLHVAGTNGKGTTCAILQSILRGYGNRCGLFTSPHMVRFTERVQVDDEEISPESVVGITGEIRQKLEQWQAAGGEAAPAITPTFFEFVTAMAFVHFMRESVDWAVFETGMGGRFDSTNVITPSLCVITSIGIDHKEFLGDTLEKIAFEKAGIIKKGVPVVVAGQRNEAMAVLRETAKALSAPLHVYGGDFRASSINAGTLADTLSNSLADNPAGTSAGNPYGMLGTRFDYEGDVSIPSLWIPLTGTHQAENAACAVRAWEILGLGDDPVPIRKALSGVRWPGRCELTHYGGMDVLSDGAHNPDAMEGLRRSIENVYLNPRNSPSFARAILLIGTMSDKDNHGMLSGILPVAGAAIFTRPDYDRATRPEKLLALAREIEPNGTYHVADTICEALSAALSVYRPGDLIVITGSFYTVGEAKELMGERAVLKNLTEFR